MNKEQIAEKLEEIVTDQLGKMNAFYKANMDGNFEDDFGADSLDQVELIMAIEEEFGIEIQDEAAEKCLTPNQALEALVKELA